MSAIAATPPVQEAEYFGHLRLDVLGHIPANAERILSVGCGAGVTEAELVRGGARVTGIELQPGPAAAARQRGLEVLEGDVESINASLRDREFDCLLYADVLEHLADPESVVRTHVESLAPGGTVVISVPNFRYLTVLWQLGVRGHIRYTDAGILDRTHLRLTTRRMVVEWLERIGLTSIGWEYTIARRRDRLINALGLGLPAEFVAQQIIVTGTNGNA